MSVSDLSTNDTEYMRVQLIRLRNRLGICIHGPEQEKDCEGTDEGCGACLTGDLPLDYAASRLKALLVAALGDIKQHSPDELDAKIPPVGKGRNPGWIREFKVKAA